SCRSYARGRDQLAIADRTRRPQNRSLAAPSKPPPDARICPVRRDTTLCQSRTWHCRRTLAVWLPTGDHRNRVDLSNRSTASPPAENVGQAAIKVLIAVPDKFILHLSQQNPLYGCA